MRLSHSLVIERTPDEVFRHLTSEPPGSPGGNSSCGEDPWPPVPGTIYREPLGLGERGGELTYEVLAYEPGRAFAIRMEGPGPFPTVEYWQLLDPVAGGAHTRVTLTVEGHLRGGWRLLEPLAACALRGRLERAVREGLEETKDELEGRRPPKRQEPAVEEPADEQGPYHARHTLRTRLTMEECRGRLEAQRSVWWRPSTWGSERDHTVEVSISRRGFSVKKSASAARHWPLVARGRLALSVDGTEIRVHFGAPRRSLLAQVLARAGFVGARLRPDRVWPLRRLDESLCQPMGRHSRDRPHCGDGRPVARCVRRGPAQGAPGRTAPAALPPPAPGGARRM